MNYVVTAPSLAGPVSPKARLLPVAALLGAAYYALQGVEYGERSDEWAKRPYPSAELRKHWRKLANQQYAAAAALVGLAALVRNA
jgi:hypothetical protein